MIKICFFGTGKPAAKTLVFLVKHGFNILQVISKPDKKKGRGMLLQQSSVTELAKKLNLNFCQPRTIKDELFCAFIKKQAADFFVVIDYGKILPQPILDLPKIAALNLHFSLLPKWRGASPVRSSIANGDPKSGVSIMKMVQQLDAGDILGKQTIKINPSWNHLNLSEELTQLGCQELKKVLSGFSQIKPLPQNEKLATYSHKFFKKDGKIDWSQSAENIFRKYKSLAPEIKLFSYYSKKKIFFLKIELADKVKKHQDIGKILLLDKQKIEVLTTQGSLFITKIQLENKNAITTKDWFNGYQIKTAQNFSNKI